MILSATGKTFDLFQAFMLFDQSCFCLLNIYTTFDSGFASSPTPVFWCKVRVECCSCTRRSHKSAGLSLFMLLLSSSMDGMKPCDLRSFDRICNYPRARPPEWFCHLSAANMEVFFFFQTCDMIKVLQFKSLVSSLNLEAAALPKTDDDLQIVNCWSAVHRLVWWSC